MAEGSHIAGTSAGRLRAGGEAVKESKQRTAEDSRKEHSCGRFVTGVKWLD